MRIALLIVLALAAAAVAGEAELPVIVDVAAPPRLGVGVAGEIRLVYRAPLANVVAVVQATDDIDGPAISRSTHEREFGVVARAFGREAGELTVPVAFSTAGWKRITLRLVTDERELSESAVIEIEVVP